MLIVDPHALTIVPPMQLELHPTGELYRIAPVSANNSSAEGTSSTIKLKLVKTTTKAINYFSSPLVSQQMSIKKAPFTTSMCSLGSTKAQFIIN